MSINKVNIVQMKNKKKKEERKRSTSIVPPRRSRSRLVLLALPRKERTPPRSVPRLIVRNGKFNYPMCSCEV